MRSAEIAKYIEAYRDPYYRMGVERQEAMARALVGLSGSFLDVGCGRGEFLEMARRHGLAPVRGTEVVPYLTGGDVVYAEAHALPFADGEFDIVSCVDVLEHLTPDDTVPVLQELRRVARRTLLLAAADYSSIWNGVELHVNARPYHEWESLIRTHVGEPGRGRQTGTSLLWTVHVGK
jgi:ubiquinone/menaquinone biosynthesis C-methylase UbiE